ncbi:hypothetical protein V8C26DRAFT_21408 [Trichoderma gracile]
MPQERSALCMALGDANIVALIWIGTASLPSQSSSDDVALGLHLPQPDLCADVSAAVGGFVAGLRWPRWTWLHIPSCMSYNYANASQISVNPRLRRSGEVESSVPSAHLHHVLPVPCRDDARDKLCSSRPLDAFQLHVALSRPATQPPSIAAPPRHQVWPADARAVRFCEPRTLAPSHQPASSPTHVCLTLGA